MHHFSRLLLLISGLSAKPVEAQPERYPMFPFVGPWSHGPWLAHGPEGLKPLFEVYSPAMEYHLNQQVMNKLAKARKMRKPPGTLSLKPLLAYFAYL